MAKSIIHFNTEGKQAGGIKVEERQQIAKTHKLTLNNRHSATITGVTDVLSFDLNEILLETEQGMLMVKGEDLHVNRLTLEKGEVDIEGRMNSFCYSEINAYAKSSEPFFSRLFK